MQIQVGGRTSDFMINLCQLNQLNHHCFLQHPVDPRWSPWKSCHNNPPDHPRYLGFCSLCDGSIRPTRLEPMITQTSHGDRIFVQRIIQSLQSTPSMVVPSAIRSLGGSMFFLQGKSQSTSTRFDKIRQAPVSLVSLMLTCYLRPVSTFHSRL